MTSISFPEMLNASVRQLEVYAALSTAGGPVNEDIVGHTLDCAWVIDGATGVGAGLTGAPSDAFWFSQTANAALKEILSCDAQIPTSQLLRAVIRYCADAFKRATYRTPADRYEYPSAAIAMVRARHDGLELTTLGDCRIIYRDGDKISRVFGSSSVARFERRTLAMARALLLENPQLEPADLQKSLAPQLRKNRQAMNSPGGYWVLGVDETAVDHIDQAVIPLDGEPVALASDGFLRLSELFHAVQPESFLKIRNNEEARSKLRELRDLEASDPRCREFLRIKPSDDASLMVVRAMNGKMRATSDWVRRVKLG